MSNSYYIIVNGQQSGPFTPEELVAKGLTDDSVVWREGLADWTRARNLPDLQPWLNPAGVKTEPQRPVYPQSPNYPQPPYPPQHPYGYPQYPPQPIRHANWMTAAIIATVLGFMCSCIGMIFGIVAIVQASNANSAYARGDAYEGDRCNSNAKVWTIVTYIVTGLGFVVSVVWGVLSYLASAL